MSSSGSPRRFPIAYRFKRKGGYPPLWVVVVCENTYLVGWPIAGWRIVRYRGAAAAIGWEDAGWERVEMSEVPCGEA